MSHEGFADLCGPHPTAMGLLERGKSIRGWTRGCLSLQHLGLLFLACCKELSHEQEKVEGRDG